MMTSDADTTRIDRAGNGTPPETCGAAGIAMLEQMDRTELLALWRRHYRMDPPPRTGDRLLALAVGWALQAREQGGLSREAERQLRALARRGKGSSAPQRRLKSGTRLVREWHGEVHVVEVTAGGYLWQGETHASLTAIARAITGAAWSGPRFFGVQKP